MNDIVRKGYSEAMLYNGQDKEKGYTETEQIERLEKTLKTMIILPLEDENNDYIEGFKLAIEDIKRWY